jgi:hypothetical protein
MIGTLVNLPTSVLQPLTPKKTEEILIDFKELIGEHSGENMAEAVWETLTKYGLKGKVSLNSGML